MGVANKMGMVAQFCARVPDYFLVQNLATMIAHKLLHPGMNGASSYMVAVEPLLQCNQSLFCSGKFAYEVSPTKCLLSSLIPPGMANNLHVHIDNVPSPSSPHIQPQSGNIRNVATYIEAFLYAHRQVTWGLQCTFKGVGTRGAKGAWAPLLKKFVRQR